ncbi:MAG: hypothetical protein MJ162_00805 [Treponema sp.]|nr:hypothetical protein [Treponema sp.]
MNPDILLTIIELGLGGIVAFLSIWIMSKTRDTSWMFLVAGFILTYIVIVYKLMLSLGIIPACTIFIPHTGIPLDSLLIVCVPNLAFIISFIIKICKK